MSEIQNLFSTYFDGFQPPNWIKKYSFDDQHLKSTICYYDVNSNLDKIKLLLSYREPVNINLTRLYHKDVLKKYFGYETSVYDTESPNIAVYCYTPVQFKLSNRFTFKNNIHVLNVIGVSLDNQNQPDYIRIKEKGQSEYVKMVCLVFKKIKYCFMTKHFKTLVIHGFGLGDFRKFASLLKIDPKKVFQIAFDEIFQDINPFWGKQIVFNNIDVKVVYPVIYKNSDIQTIIYEYKTLDDVLFINAWDPFSIIGNGNSLDDSLDGYFGRITAMSILGWPFTNEYITYQRVENVNIYYSDILDYKDPLFVQYPFQMIWHNDKFVDMTKSLVQKAKQKYKKKEIVSYRNEKLINFLQKPFDISKMRLVHFHNEMMQWPLETTVHTNIPWAITTLTLYEFPYGNSKLSLHLKDYPYRRNQDGKVVPIPFLYHNLLYTDLDGIMLNSEWFHLQIEYIKKLKISDQKLLFDYSFSPDFVYGTNKKRLQKIIKESPKLLNPLIVWRGINQNYFKKYTDTYKTDIYDSSLHGNFQSTSILPNVASGNFMGQPCCLCQILLMPETSCLFLAISGLSHEREILLPLDIKFKIVDNTIDIKNPLNKDKTKMIRMYTID